MVYLVGGYLVLWAILFGYVFSLHLRQRRLEQELDSLRLRRDEDGDD